MVNETISDIVPVVAMPVGGPTNAVSFSRGPKWLFTGGEDGFVRKYNLVSSLNGEAPLTVAQRHQIVDSITLGGALDGYWENEVPQLDEKLPPTGVYQPQISPVYSLTNDPNGFWVLSGQDNGGISLMSSRMNEGGIQWYFRDANTCSSYQGMSHSDTVSCLTMGRDSTSFLSGSWDKSCIEWDLDVGKGRRRFQTGGQVSSVEWRPTGSLEVEVCVTGDAGDEEEEEEDNGSLFGSDDEDDEADKPGATAAQGRVVDSEHTFMTSTITGEINIWDVRAPLAVMGIAGGSKITRSWSMSACWAEDGGSIFVGGKKGGVSQWDIRALEGSPPIREIKLPAMSGLISSVARISGRYIVLGGEDNVRVFDLEGNDSETGGIPYQTVPSHSRGLVGAIKVENGFMAVARGARGWGVSNADHVFLYKVEFGPME